jgi:hypothetical protein
MDGIGKIRSSQGKRTEKYAQRRAGGLNEFIQGSRDRKVELVEIL